MTDRDTLRGESLEKIAKEFRVPPEYARQPLLAQAYIDGYRDGLLAVRGSRDHDPPDVNDQSGEDPEDAVDEDGDTNAESDTRN